MTPLLAAMKRKHRSPQICCSQTLAVTWTQAESDQIRSSSHYLFAAPVTRCPGEASDESIRTRLELAYRRIRALIEQNQELSDELAQALGELRAVRTRGTSTRSA